MLPFFSLQGEEYMDAVATLALATAAFLATHKPYAADAWEKLSSALDAHASLWRSLRTE